MIKIGQTMCHRTRESLEQDPLAQAWLLWATQRGIATQIGREHYYNLPARNINESMDDDETRSEYWWEIRADMPAYPDEYPSPQEMELAAYVFPGKAKKSAEEILQLGLEKSASMRRLQAEEMDRKAARKVELLARAKQVVPAGLPLGTKMAERMQNAGGESLELAHLATMDEIRAALAK